MAFDPVPYFIGGGAQHSAEVMRFMAYLATGGIDGVFESLDFRVLATATPGANVRIMPGAGCCVCRYPNISKQSYVMRAPDETVVAIAPTGAGVARSDLVIARVRDPHIATSGDPDPVSIANGPYVVPFVVSGVPNTTKSHLQVTPPLGYSAITLARVDIPASTATITQAMIKDLRSIANAITGNEVAPEAEGSNEAESRVVTRWANGSGGTGDVKSYTSTAYTSWPAIATWTVQVPKWATTVDVDVEVRNAQLRTGDVMGYARLYLGGSTGCVTMFDLNHPGGTANVKGNHARVAVPVAGSFPVPSGMRGTNVTLRVETQMINDGNQSGALHCKDGTSIRAELNFKQTPQIA